MRFSYYNRLSRADRAIYRRSDSIAEIALPDPEPMQALCHQLRLAREQKDTAAFGGPCTELARGICGQLSIEPPVVLLFDEPRPHSSAEELQGLYEPEPPPARISIWLRTAKRQQVIAFKTFLRTLLHELVHHIDYEYLMLEDSFHTEGFFKREADLYRQLLPESLVGRRL